MPQSWNHSINFYISFIVIALAVFAKRINSHLSVGEEEKIIPCICQMAVCPFFALSLERKVNNSWFVLQPPELWTLFEELEQLKGQSSNLLTFVETWFAVYF